MSDHPLEFVLHADGSVTTASAFALASACTHAAPASFSAPFVSSAGPSGPKGPNAPQEPGRAPEEGEDVDLEDEPVNATPRRYKVIFHNDDYTTQEFVVYVLERFFHKSETEARHIMLTVHHKGAAVAGVYTKDVAETKAQQVMDLAREHGMPLLLTTEPE